MHTYPLRTSSSSSSSSVSIDDIVAPASPLQPPFMGIISADPPAVVAVSVASLLTQVVVQEEVLASDSRMWLISGGIGLGRNLLRPGPESGEQACARARMIRQREQTRQIHL